MIKFFPKELEATIYDLIAKNRLLTAYECDIDRRGRSTDNERTTALIIALPLNNDSEIIATIVPHPAHRNTAKVSITHETGNSKSTIAEGEFSMNCARELKSGCSVVRDRLSLIQFNINAIIKGGK